MSQSCTRLSGKASRLKMWRSFSGVRELRDNFKHRHLLSSSELGISSRLRIWRKNLSSWCRCHLFSQKKCRSSSWDHTTWLRIWQLQTLAQRLYLQMYLQTERNFFFLERCSGFSKRESQEPSNFTNVASYLAFFLFLHIYSLRASERKKVAFGFMASPPEKLSANLTQVHQDHPESK